MKQSYLVLSRKDNWVRPYFKKYKKLLALVLFLGFLTFFCGSALMFTSGFLISKSATQPWNVLAVYVPIVLTRAFGIGRPAFRYAERLGSHNWVLKMTSDIRLKLYQSLETRATRAKEEFQSGDILGILAEDIEHIQNLYLRTIFPTLIGLLLYVFIVVAFGAFSLPFALLILLLLGILIVFLPLASVAVNQGRSYRRKAKRHVLYNELTDSVLGVGDWQYSGRYEDFLDHYSQSLKAVRQEEASLNRSKRIQGTIVQFVFGWIVVAIYIWVGSYFYQTNQDNLNWIAAFVLATFPLMDAFGPISQGVAELPMYEDSTRRLHQLPIPSDKPEKSVSEEVLAKLTGKIDVKDLSFTYSNQTLPIFTEFDLTIHPGETVAILGKSGTGKTTLAKLLRGDLLPSKGEITLDGLSLEHLEPSMSKVIGVLNQAPHLFNTSLYNNVQLGNLNASEEEVMRAISQAGLDPVIAKLADGVQTLVEEGGKRFSGGEQQRIALARILLQATPIVIIDEPTIGLDPITEKSLLETVFKELEGKTVIWITHHLLSIEHADRVVFLEKGQVKMDGTPEELSMRDKHYQALLALDYV